MHHQPLEWDLEREREMARRPEKVSYRRPAPIRPQSVANVLDPECSAYNPTIEYAQAMGVKIRGLGIPLDGYIDPGFQDEGSVEDLSDLEDDPRFSDMVM